ncbi:MAG: hypothetical protein ACI965_000063 [Paraglaciecola sp.]|jgi:hypothetical protein
MLSSRSFLLLFAVLSLNAKAVEEFTIELRQHLFYPSRIDVPAHQKVKLIIHNLDEQPEEFDSFDLNREKMLFPGRLTTIFIGPLRPGEYTFFGEYHPNKARGLVVASEQTKGEQNAH